MSIFGKPVSFGGDGGGGIPDIDYSYLPNSPQANVLMSESWHKYEENTFGRFVPSLTVSDDALYLPGTSGVGLRQELEGADTDVTCYLAGKGEGSPNGFPLSVPYAHSYNQCPLFYFTGSSVKYANYGGDVTISGLSPTDYHVYAIAVDATNKKTRFFVDGVFIGEKTGLVHSGNRVAFAKDRDIATYGCNLYFRYGGVVSQFETDADIIANMQTIMTKCGIT